MTTVEEILESQGYLVKSYPSLTKKDILTANKYLRKHRDKKVCIRIPSTLAVTDDILALSADDMYFRIENGNEDDKIASYNNETPETEQWQTVHTLDVVYTKDELQAIMEAIYHIEKEINPNWNEMTKAASIYQYLIMKIDYDRTNLGSSTKSKDTRSLLALLSDKTVCCGYALTYKELLNRQGIKCDYVLGNLSTRAHAWNLVYIEDDIFGVDLTIDASNTRHGKTHEVLNFANFNSKEDFITNHVPGQWEQIQNYEKNLTFYDDEMLNNLFRTLSSRKEYYTAFPYKRADNKPFIIFQVGRHKNKELYRYLCMGLDKNDQLALQLVYADDNLADMYNYSLDLKDSIDELSKITKLTVEESRFIAELKESLTNDLLLFNQAKKRFFSVGNLEASRKIGREYIGSLDNDGKNTIMNTINLFEEYPTKNYHRQDGSTFLLMKTAMPYTEDGVKLHAFDCLEPCVDKDRMYVARNRLYSEMDLTLNNTLNSSDFVINQFLSRERIDAINRHCSGYMGYVYNNQIFRQPLVADYFKDWQESQTNQGCKSYIKK
ncbi:MAG: transglutaminase domain-containing protein [Bacilli bacterium]